MKDFCDCDCGCCCDCPEVSLLFRCGTDYEEWSGTSENQGCWCGCDCGTYIPECTEETPIDLILTITGTATINGDYPFTLSPQDPLNINDPCCYKGNPGIVGTMPMNPIPVLPITVYCTGGYTGECRIALANGQLTQGCDSVFRGTITTLAGLGSSVTVTGAAFVAGAGLCPDGDHYSSLEVQAVDAMGRLVYSAHTYIQKTPPWPGTPGYAPTDTPAQITFTYADCLAYAIAPTAFQNGPPWCNNPMGSNPDCEVSFFLCCTKNVGWQLTMEVFPCTGAYANSYVTHNVINVVDPEILSMDFGTFLSSEFTCEPCGPFAVTCTISKAPVVPFMAKKEDYVFSLDEESTCCDIVCSDCSCEGVSTLGVGTNSVELIYSAPYAAPLDKTYVAGQTFLVCLPDGGCDYTFSLSNYSYSNMGTGGGGYELIGVGRIEYVADYIKISIYEVTECHSAGVIQSATGVMNLVGIGGTGLPDPANVSVGTGMYGERCHKILVSIESQWTTEDGSLPMNMTCDLEISDGGCVTDIGNCSPCSYVPATLSSVDICFSVTNLTPFHVTILAIGDGLVTATIATTPLWTLCGNLEIFINGSQDSYMATDGEELIVTITSADEPLCCSCCIETAECTTAMPFTMIRNKPVLNKINLLNKIKKRQMKIR